MPQPGAPFPTGFIYIEVPFSRVRQQTPTFGTFASIEPYTTIEQYIKGRCIFGSSLKDLLDSTRVYRLPNTARGQFPENPCKDGEFFLPFGDERFIILDTDPSIGKASKTFDWVPLG